MSFSRVGQAQLARLLSIELGRSIDRAAVNKMVTGKRSISGDELLVIEKITGYKAYSQVHVPVAGRVQDDHFIDSELAFRHNEITESEESWRQYNQELDADVHRPLEEKRFVPAPARSSPNSFAILVATDVLYPIYEYGTLIFFDGVRNVEKLANQRALVTFGDKRSALKIVREGRVKNRWIAQSLTSTVADIVDLEMIEASRIDFVKPPN